MFIRTLSFSLSFFFFFFGFETLQFRIQLTAVQFQRFLTNIALIDYVRYSSVIKLLSSENLFLHCDSENKVTIAFVGDLV